MQTIAIDFDGVIHRYSKGWDDGTIYDGPVDNALASMEHLLQLGYALYIHSTRDPYQIVEWFRELTTVVHFVVEPIHPNDLIDHKFWQGAIHKSGLPVVGVTNQKLPAVIYIDDRGVRFKSWVQTLNFIRGKDFAKGGLIES